MTYVGTNGYAIRSVRALRVAMEGGGTAVVQADDPLRCLDVALHNLGTVLPRLEDSRSKLEPRAWGSPSLRTRSPRGELRACGYTQSTFNETLMCM